MHRQELGQARWAAAAMAASEAGVSSFGATPKAARELERKAAGERSGAMVHFFPLLFGVWCTTSREENLSFVGTKKVCVGIGMF